MFANKVTTESSSLHNKFTDDKGQMVLYFEKKVENLRIFSV
jgi:hypothetical protein